MTRMILSDTIFTYEVVVFAIIMAILIIKKKLQIKQFFFLVGLFGSFTIYVKKVFKTIIIGDPVWSTKGSYSLIPFGNVITLMTNNEEFTNEIKTQIFDFFIGVVPFLILSGFLIAGLFSKKISYKKMFIEGCVILELLQLIAFLLIFNDMVYMGLFDTSVFLLVPILYGLGLLLYKILIKEYV